MKKIILSFLMLEIYSGSFAQEPNDSGKIQNSKHDYYMMEGEFLIHYYIDVKSDTVFNDIRLNKSKTLTTKAELINKKRRIIFLNNGECVDSKGSIIDCNRVKKRLEARTEKSDSEFLENTAPQQLSTYTKKK